MAFHTMAYVDLGALRAGESTPIHTTHTWLAVAVYPLFGLILIAVIRLAQREGVLGSAWIGWIGMLGRNTSRRRGPHRRRGGYTAGPSPVRRVRHMPVPVVCSRRRLANPRARRRSSRARDRNGLDQPFRNPSIVSAMIFVCSSLEPPNPL